MLHWSRARPEAASGSPESTIEGENVLIVRACADRQAFAPLYHRYLGPIYRYCYRRLGSREAAEDTTSQVFCKALAALPSYRGGSFKGWLFAIARNAVSDALCQRRPEAPLQAAEPSPTRRRCPRIKFSPPRMVAPCRRFSPCFQPTSGRSWSGAWPA